MPETTEQSDPRLEGSCPHCGKDSSLLSDTHIFWVRCGSCKAEGTTSRTLEGAVTLWLRREGKAPNCPCCNGEGGLYSNVFGFNVTCNNENCEHEGPPSDNPEGARTNWLQRV